MFGLGLTELIIIAGLALIIIGPEKFPDFAKIVIRTVRDVRGYVDEVQRDLNKELRPVRKELKDLNKYSAEDYIDSLNKSESDKAKNKPKQLTSGDGEKPASKTSTHTRRTVKQDVPTRSPDDGGDDDVAATEEGASGGEPAADAGNAPGVSQESAGEGSGDAPKPRTKLPDKEEDAEQGNPVIP